MTQLAATSERRQASAGRQRGVAPDNAFRSMGGKKRHYKGLLYRLLCVISGRDWHLAALCVLCKCSGESRLVRLRVCLSVCLSLAGSCLPTLKANICSLITSPLLLLSSPSWCAADPLQGQNMKSGLLSVAAAALLAALLSSVDAQGRKTAVHLRSTRYSAPLAPPVFPRLPLPPSPRLCPALVFVSWRKFDASLSTWCKPTLAHWTQCTDKNKIKFLIHVYAVMNAVRRCGCFDPEPFISPFQPVLSKCVCREALQAKVKIRLPINLYLASN